MILEVAGEIGGLPASHETPAGRACVSNLILHVKLSL